MFARRRRKAQIRRRKRKRETSRDDATRFKDLVIAKAQERGVKVPAKLARQLRNASRQRDGHLRLYKLDLRRCRLMDDHVEALTDALLELPVLRKLDLRRNKAITVRSLSALMRLLKAQVKLFKLTMQVGTRPFDLSKSFLYSVKLNATALTRDVNLAGEMESHMAALQVADTVVDARHAFFQADTDKTGTLSSVELAGAMRIVMGVTPKRKEMERSLRLWGQTSPNEGEDPKLINLEGFEAAMAEQLREAKMLEPLSRARDDLLFGLPDDETDASNYVSPWSSRSFGATRTKVDGTTERERRYRPSSLSPSGRRPRGCSNELQSALDPFMCNSDAENKRPTHEDDRSGNDDRAVDVLESCGAKEHFKGAKIKTNHEIEMHSSKRGVEGISTSCSKSPPSRNPEAFGASSFTELRVEMDRVTSPNTVNAGGSETPSDSRRRYRCWRGFSPVSHGRTSPSTTRSLNQAAPQNGAKAVNKGSTVPRIDITTAPNVDGNLNRTEDGKGGVYKRRGAEASHPPGQAGVIANAPEESKPSTKASKHSANSTPMIETVPSVALKPSLHPNGRFREEERASAKAGSLLFGDGTTMRTPHCLTPVNVLATARPLTYSCEERQLLAARIYQSAENSTTFSRERATTRGTHTPLISSCVNVSLRVSIAPEHPESDSKALYNGADLNRGARGEPASKCSNRRWRRIGDQEKCTDKTGANRKQNESPPDNHDFLAVHFRDHSLEMSRNALTDMDIVLELEATHGICLDTLNGLHTLVLSSNQLKDLDFTVLTAMPALRNLDVSNNLLSWMAPGKGLDLPQRLETLNMSHNCISRIGGISRCYSICTIDLSYNRIKNVLGLEHLSLLEQLDLSHNLIFDTASVRALSFNISLQFLRLEGNPVAKHLRYRAALACLLPHVRAIDSWGTLRSPTGSNVGDGGKIHEIEAHTRTGSWGDGNTHIASTAGTRRRVTRESQAEQDDRRSRDWHNVLKWREKQAQLEDEKERHAWDAKRKIYEAVDAAHQRRLMEKLARPRSQTYTSGVTFGKAKVIASHRPGVSHGRCGRGDDGFNLTRSNKPVPTKLAEESAKEIRLEEPQNLDVVSATLSGVFDPNGGDSRGAPRECNGELSERVSTVGIQGIHSLASGKDENLSEKRRDNKKSRAARKSQGFPFYYSWIEDHIEVDDDISFTVPNGDPNTAAAKEGNAKSSHHFGDISSSRSRNAPHISQIGNDSPVQQPSIASALPASVSSASPRDFALTPLSADGADFPELTTDSTIRRRSEEEELVARAGRPKVETCLENLPRAGGPPTVLEAELLDGWLRDVRLETEVAGLALQVLLEMCKKRKNRIRQDQQRLARLRVALENMDLLSDSHDTAPTVAGSKGGYAEEIITATRQITATKAAVRQMLSLLEEADLDKGESDDKDGLDHYAEFIRQQPDIIATTGGGKSDKNHDDRPLILRCHQQGNLAKTAFAEETVVTHKKTPLQSTRLSNGGVFTVSSRNSSVASLLSSKSGIPSSGEGGRDGKAIGGDSGAVYDFEKTLDGEDMSNEAVDIEPLSYVPARVTRELQEVGDGKVRERNACDRSVVETEVASTGMVSPMAPETDIDDNKLAQVLLGNASMFTQESVVADDIPLGGKRGTERDDHFQNDSRHLQVQIPKDVGEYFDLTITKSATEGRTPDSVLRPERAMAREGSVTLDASGAKSMDEKFDDEFDERNLGEATALNIDSHVSLSREVVIVSHTKNGTGPVSVGEELHPGAGVSGQAVEHAVDPNVGEGATKSEKCSTTSQAGSPEVTTELAWVEGYDSTHDCYYYHHVHTGESTWHKPNEPFEPYVHPEEHGGDQELAFLSKNDQVSESRAKPKAGRNERRARRRSRNEDMSVAAAKKDDKGREKSHHGRQHKRGEEGQMRTVSKTGGASSFRRKTLTRRASSRKKCASSSSSTSLSDLEGRDRSHGGGSGGVQGQRLESQSKPSTSRRDKDRSQQSRRHEVKSALERLNDLTDENSDMFSHLSRSSEEQSMRG